MTQDDRGIVVARVAVIAARSSPSATPKSCDG
jgi:hypothetical protein